MKHGYWRHQTRGRTPICSRITNHYLSDFILSTFRPSMLLLILIELWFFDVDKNFLGAHANGNVITDVKHSCNDLKPCSTTGSLWKRSKAVDDCWTSETMLFMHGTPIRNIIWGLFFYFFKNTIRIVQLNLYFWLITYPLLFRISFRIVSRHQRFSWCLLKLSIYTMLPKDDSTSEVKKIQRMAATIRCHALLYTPMVRGLMIGGCIVGIKEPRHRGKYHFCPLGNWNPWARFKRVEMVLIGYLTSPWLSNHQTTGVSHILNTYASTAWIDQKS